MKVTNKAFKEMYEKLYKLDEKNEVNYYPAVNEFDRLLQWNTPFKKSVQEFVKKRKGDPISSDREAAAYYLCFTKEAPEKYLKKDDFLKSHIIFTYAVIPPKNR